jgi:transmembrane sensor
MNHRAELPVSPAVVEQASEWLMLHWGGEMTDAQQRAFVLWQRADAEHARAWQRLQDLQQTLGRVPRDCAQAVLKDAPQRSRRDMLKLLSLILVTGATGYSLHSQKPWRGALADQHTAVGEIRRLTLEDGTRLDLDTDSAVDVLFSASHRRIRLIKGAILLETGHNPEYLQRPLIVQTGAGEIQALGTRFCVAEAQQGIRVDLYTGMLEVRPIAAAAQRLVEGQSLWFDQDRLGVVTATDPNAGAWSEGHLIAERQPLGQFLSQLSRYRPGILRCDPAAAPLLITGVFPLADTDAILAALARSLPVRVQQATRYWVTVKRLT